VQKAFEFSLVMTERGNSQTAEKYSTSYQNSNLVIPALVIITHSVHSFWDEDYNDIIYIMVYSLAGALDMYG